MVVASKVYLWDTLVGVVFWDVRYNTASFEYDPSFLQSGLPIAPLTMPLRAGVFQFPELNSDTFMGLPGVLADSLPDAFGRALLNQWLRAQNRENANPVERLCYQGKRSMGALEFQPTLNDKLYESSAIDVGSLVDVASMALQNKEMFGTSMAEPTQAMLDILRVGTSAGGQRAKAVIAYNDVTKEVRSGQVEAPNGFDYWLLKLDGVTNQTLGDPQHFGQIEYVHYLLAKKAGIQMTECRLMREHDRAHFMTKRFDRLNGEKVHMLTLCGIAHLDYKRLHLYSYENAFSVMRQLQLPMPQIEEFYRRMVFNVIARNQDDHTKNISFLMDKQGQWRLSPAYDMSWAYNPSGGWTNQHQMSVNGKWDNITKEDLLKVGIEVNVKKAALIIEQVQEAISTWVQEARNEGIPQHTIEQIENTRAYIY